MYPITLHMSSASDSFMACTVHDTVRQFAASLRIALPSDYSSAYTLLASGRSECKVVATFYPPRDVDSHTWRTDVRAAWYFLSGRYGLTCAHVVDPNASYEGCTEQWPVPLPDEPLWVGGMVGPVLTDAPAPTTFPLDTHKRTAPHGDPLSPAARARRRLDMSRMRKR